MTTLKQTKACRERFERDFKNGLFSQDDGVVLKLWAREMEEFGPLYIKDSPDWRDHALTREWRGYRASSFSKDGRIIYRIISDTEVEICEIERITPNHDYKK